MVSSSINVVEQPIFTRRKLRIVAIGAGIANLILAYKHKYQGDNAYLDLVLYEKNAGIGGTWYENKYPGVACDVPAHIYAFPFAPNPDWSSFYVSGPEILDYINKTVDQFQLRDYVKLQSKVTSAVWSEEKGKWIIKIDCAGRSIEEEADVLVNGSGILNRWAWPDIPGIDRFQGKLVHSANWDPDMDWTGKRVGLIGNGSSAIQILPQMQPKAKSIDTYIRTPTWIVANFLANFTPDGANFKYSAEQKKGFRESPGKLRDHRREMEHVFNCYFAMLIQDSPQQEGVRGMVTDAMKQQLGVDSELAEKLIPDFPVGCRRITPGDGYLEAIKSDNVRVRFEKVVEFDEKGIVSQPAADTDPEANEYDIIVCATGFDVSFVPAWEMKGMNGADLRKLWESEAEGYLGICAPEMPNYFIFNGPNCPIGHGSLMACMDFASDYILRWCDKIASEGIKSMIVKPDALKEFNEYSQAWLQRSVWSSNCRSWYKNHKEKGRVSAMYAGSVLHYRALLAAFRTDDFDITYQNKQNRFGFLGNGTTEYEAKGENLGFYLEK